MICVIITISKASAWPLDSRIDFWEYASFVGALIVIIGIAIECFELAEKWIEKWGKEKPQLKEQLFNSACVKSAVAFAKKWEIEIETVGFVIVIVGLIIELGGSITAFRLSNQRDAITNREAGEANKIAAESNERSKGLEATNLVLRSNVVALEIKFGNGHISRQQHTNLVTCLRTWDGPRNPIMVGCQSFNNRPEALTFFRELLEVFNDGTAIAYEVPWDQGIYSSPVPGIILFVRDKEHPPLAALFIQKCFSDNGLSPISIVQNEFKTNDPPQIIGVFVSSKP